MRCGALYWDPSKAVFERSTDARYVGQGYELRVPLPAGQLGQAELEAAVGKFHDMHRQEYGHHFPDSVVELVNLRVTAISEVAKIGAPESPQGGSLAEARIRTDETMFRVDGKLVPLQTDFYDRGRLPVDEEFCGPAIILQTDSTTVVPPDCTAILEKSGSLIIKVGAVAKDLSAGSPDTD